jgi:hypothetical protein
VRPQESQEEAHREVSHGGRCEEPDGERGGGDHGLGRLAQVEQGLGARAQDDRQGEQEREAGRVAPVEAAHASRADREAGAREPGQESRRRLRDADPERIAERELREAPLADAARSQPFGQQEVDAGHEHRASDQAERAHVGG